MDELRKIIAECIRPIFEQDDSNIANSPILGNTFNNLEDQLKKDAQNVQDISKLNQKEIDNQTAKLKADMQTKSRLTQDSPERKGLEVSLPLKQKDLDQKKKDSANLNNAAKGIDKAKDELDKQKKELELKQMQQNNKTAQKTQTQVTSVLPNLQSPI